MFSPQPQPQPTPQPQPHRPTGRRTIAVLAMAVGFTTAATVTVTGCGRGADTTVGRDGASSAPASSACVSNDEPPCGVSFEELRSTNLHYADRIDFIGDPGPALATAEQVRAALQRVVDELQPNPSPDDIEATLAPWSDEVQVSTNAVRTAGTGFGFPVDGGCVFGSVSNGEVVVNVGGYINDGGCLAVFGH
jgi:hypothetical protein